MIPETGLKNSSKGQSDSHRSGQYEGGAWCEDRQRLPLWQGGGRCFLRLMKKNDSRPALGVGGASNSGDPRVGCYPKLLGVNTWQLFIYHVWADWLRCPIRGEKPPTRPKWRIHPLQLVIVITKLRKNAMVDIYGSLIGIGQATSCNSLVLGLSKTLV